MSIFATLDKARLYMESIRGSNLAVTVLISLDIIEQQARPALQT